jgi:hypothetical protein
MRTRYEHSVKPSTPLEILIGTEDAESSLDTFEQRIARFMSATTISVGQAVDALQRSPPWQNYIFGQLP